MRRVTVVCLCLSAILAVLPSVVAVQTSRKLTNDDVIRMVSSGMSSDLVVQVIQSNDQAYELNPDTLVAMHNAGVPDAVIQAMLARSNPNGPASSQTSAPTDPYTAVITAYTPEPVQYVDGTSRTAMQQTTTTTRSSGGLRAMAGSMKIRNAFPGKYSEFRISSATPSFEVSIPANGRAGDSVILVALDVKSDRREVEILGTSMMGSRSGFPEGRTVALRFDEIASKVGSPGTYYKRYRVTATVPLKSGEYALVCNSSYYDFGVDAER